MIRKCINGPYDGQQLKCSAQATLPFTAKGMSGQYRVSPNGNFIWEAKA